MNSGKRNVWAFDVLKFTLAIVIVSLHAGVSEAFVMPINNFVRNFQNLAVPCFFLVSSVLFFGKVFQEGNTQYQWKQLWHYEKRLFLLYGIWQLVLLPVSLLTHDYVEHGLMGVLYYLKDMLFSYTFPASWFFGALIVAMPLVFVVRNKPLLQLVIALLIIVALAICLRWCQITGVIALFYLAGCFMYSDKNATLYLRFRKYSTLFYCMHFTIIHILWQVVSPDSRITIWLISLCVCLLLSEVIIRLSGYRHFYFLKQLM